MVAMVAMVAMVMVIMLVMVVMVIMLVMVIMVIMVIMVVMVVIDDIDQTCPYFFSARGSRAVSPLSHSKLCQLPEKNILKKLFNNILQYHSKLCQLIENLAISRLKIFLICFEESEEQIFSLFPMIKK